MKISIIIPVYNVLDFISECVNSVLNQTYKNFEILLVDDGSTDGSSQLCDEFGNKDNRIRVYHKKNGGLSDARNYGICRATGDYIIFLDSDDFWDDLDALKRLVERLLLTNPDVLSYSYKKYYKSTNLTVNLFDNIEDMPLSCNNKLKQADYMTSKFLFIASACNKIIRTSLFDDALYFKSGVVSEDIEWCAKLLDKSKSLDFICENFYCYRQREGSITHSISKKSCDDLTHNILQCIDIAENNSDMKEYIYRYTAYSYGTFFIVQSYSKMYPKDDVEILSKYKWLLSYHCNNKKIKLLHMLCKTIGYKPLCKIVRFTKICRR